MAVAGLFVTGTDTGVGKTHVAAAIAFLLEESGRRVGVLKPVASGAEWLEGALSSEDTRTLAAAIGGGVPSSRVTPLVYEEPLAPVVAARRARAPLLHADIEAAVAAALAWWSSRADLLVIEGVGGFLCPLAEDSTVADLALGLDYPVLIVSRRGLGTLNHTLLTVEAVRTRGLAVAGIVLDTPAPGPTTLAERTNAEELARRLPGVPVLAELGHADPTETRAMLRGIDWAGLMRRPRHAPIWDRVGAEVVAASSIASRSGDEG